MNAFRQGDVSILAVKDVPKAARRVKGELVLARGELSGHAHRIVEGKASLHRLQAGGLFLRVESRSARLFHEEHEDVRRTLVTEPAAHEPLTDELPAQQAMKLIAHASASVVMVMVWLCSSQERAPLGQSSPYE